MKTLTKKQKELLNRYPLLQIVNDTRFSMRDKIWFKAEVIAHGGFIDGERKDVVSCANFIHTSDVY